MIIAMSRPSGVLDQSIKSRHRQRDVARINHVTHDDKKQQRRGRPQQQKYLTDFEPSRRAS
jgi:hypothetical protein